MSTYAIIRSDNTVDNIILWDGVSAWTPPNGCSIVEITLLTGTPSIGSTLCDGQFIAPEPEVPTEVSMASFRESLIVSGVDVGIINNMLNTITDPIQRNSALVRWEYATVVERKHPLVSAVQALMGLSDKAVDAIFRLAAGL
jgi:hypothetical protein